MARNGYDAGLDASDDGPGRSSEVDWGAVYRLRVRYAECDPQGIVFNAHYLSYCDVAITELFREALGAWSVLTDRGYDAVVAEAKLRFRFPARFDEELELWVRVTDLGTTGMTTFIDIVRHDLKLVEIELRHVFVSSETWKKTRIPDWVRGPLQRTPAYR